MPHYLFAVDGDPFSPDPRGVALAGPQAARSQAVVAAGEALRDLDGRLWDAPGQQWRMQVTDKETGATVCVLTFRGEAMDAPG